MLWVAGARAAGSDLAGSVVSRWEPDFVKSCCWRGAESCDAAFRDSLGVTVAFGKAREMAVFAPVGSVLVSLVASFAVAG